MHILIVPSWYKTPEKPVTGTFFEEQARMLQNNGYKIGILYSDHVMRFNFNQSNRKLQPKNFIDNGIPTFYSFTNSILPRVKRINYLFACIKAYSTYKQYVKQFGKPDIIHAHATFIGGIVANYISKKEKIPYVLTEHFTGLILSNYIFDNNSEKKTVEKVFNEASYALIVSNYFKEELFKKYGITNSKLQVIPNMVNPIFYNTYVPKQKSDPFIILCVAFLTPRKQHKLLFDAILQLIKVGYNISLRLIGDGEYKNELVKYVEENELQKHIVFLGNQERTIVKQEIDNAHILVSSSAFETFGVNIIEALACGRPVVAIDSGGPRDIINKENGILVKENSANKLVEAIVYMIQNYNNYNQKNIIEDCISKYSEDTILAETEKIYQELYK